MVTSILYDLNHAALWQRQMRVWDRTMRAPSFDRLLYLFLHRLGWMGEQEAALLRALIKPGMRIVDVGANIGLYALLCARLTGETGRVFAFEPEQNLYRRLRENCARNGVANVESFECAAGSSPGRAAFRRSAFNSGDNRLDSHGSGAVQVEVVRIDDVLPVSSVDFIKIDVQGHELGALQGMERLLANDCVRVLFEFSPAALRDADTAPEALLRFFSDRGFRIYQTDQPALAELTEPGEVIQQLRGRRYTNLLASRIGVPSR